MRLTQLTGVLLGGLLVSPLTGTASLLNPATPRPVARQDFTVALSGFSSHVQLTFPQGARSPLPTVLLLHAGYPSDLDGSFFEDGRQVSQNLRDIAEFLSSHGYGVVRYNKRYVTGPGRVQAGHEGSLPLDELVKDAAAVLKSMRGQPLVDRQRLFVLGWSEGAAVAVRLGLLEPALRGVILIGPPVVVQGVDYGNLKLLPSLRVPLLTLQGNADSITTAQQTRQLQGALKSRPDATFNYYPGLGHGLGPSGVPLNSQFAPIDAVPLRDLLSWLNRNSQ